MQQSTETTGMNGTDELSTATEGMNTPSDEFLVAPARRLQYEAPPSKHAKGRQKALPKKGKARRKARTIRENRARAADLKVLTEALNG